MLIGKYLEIISNLFCARIGYKCYVNNDGLKKQTKGRFIVLRAGLLTVGDCGEKIRKKEM